MSRITAPVGRGDDADHLRQEGELALAVGIEEALAGEFLPPFLQQLQQRAFPRQLQALDQELIGGAAGIAGDPPDGDDLQPVLRRDRQPARGGAPADGIQLRLGVLEGEIEMARAGALEAADLAPHPDPLEGTLQGALHRDADLADGVLGQIAGVVGHPGGILCCRAIRAIRGGSRSGEGRHADIGGGRRRPGACAVLGDRRLAAHDQAFLRSGQCRDRRRSRMRGHRRR